MDLRNRVFSPPRPDGRGPTARAGEALRAGTCSRRHLSAAHSTSQEALSLAYCCCSRRRACSSSRSSVRRSSSRLLSAPNSCWFSATCGSEHGVGSAPSCKGILLSRHQGGAGLCPRCHCDGYRTGRKSAVRGTETGGPYAAGRQAPRAETAKGLVEQEEGRHSGWCSAPRSSRKEAAGGHREPRSQGHKDTAWDFRHLKLQLGVWQDVNIAIYAVTVMPATEPEENT